MRRFVKWSKTNWLVWAVAAAYVFAAATRPEAAAGGGIIGLQTFGELAATLVTVFVIVGLFQVWVTDDFIMKHLGEGSGFRALAIGAGVGTIIHGPLVGIFPLLDALFAKGARAGVIVAIVSTWAIKLPMIPLELRLFGWQFTLLREGLLFASAFVMAPLMDLALGKEWARHHRATGQGMAGIVTPVRISSRYSGSIAQRLPTMSTPKSLAARVSNDRSSPAMRRVMSHSWSGVASLAMMTASGHNMDMKSHRTR